MTLSGAPRSPLRCSVALTGSASKARPECPFWSTDWPPWGVSDAFPRRAEYGIRAAFWGSLGFTNVFETDDGSGQWENPAGGPYVFISEQHEGELEMHPILHVADSTAFAPDRTPDFARPFTPQHRGVVEALLRDPDGRNVSLQAPLPDGVGVPSAESQHREKYGSH